MRKSIYYIITLFVLIAVSCREPFDIQTGFGRGGFLVVDGYINVGEGITTIKLSRTTPIDVVAEQIQETGASVVIEDDQFTYPLTEQKPGVYVSEELNLPFDRDYRLRITTGDDNVYLSDYTTPVKAPPIDSVTWVQNFDGVNISVTTHDPLNQTKRYQWEFEEVWEEKSPYTSYVKFENNEFINRPNEEIKSMLTCWHYTTNSLINIGSTDQLTQDVIIKHPITFIPEFSKRLVIRYSILVKQHALNKDAFEFFQIILKNNESLGTFTDPQPAQLTGNINSLTSNEVVVGYIGASTTETTRIMINRNELSSWSYRPSCIENEFTFERARELVNFYTFTRYRAALIDGNPVITGVYGVNPLVCADCRANGGVNIIPSFWDINEE